MDALLDVILAKRVILKDDGTVQFRSEVGCCAAVMCHVVCNTCVMKCWRGYMSGARCIWSENRKILLTSNRYTSPKEYCRQRNCTNVLFGCCSLTTGVVFSFQSSITHSDTMFRQQQREKFLKSTEIYFKTRKQNKNNREDAGPVQKYS